MGESEVPIWGAQLGVGESEVSRLGITGFLLPLYIMEFFYADSSQR